MLELLVFFGGSKWLVGWGDGHGGFVALLRAKGKRGGEAGCRDGGVLIRER